MTHSSIIEVGLFPIEEQDRISQKTIFATNSWFVGEVADYLDDAHRDDVIELLSKTAKGFIISEDACGKFIQVTDKKAYFTPQWEAFQQKNHASIPLEAFMGLRGLDESDIYIYADGELMTFDEFIRGSVGAEPYYIGGIVDYHY